MNTREAIEWTEEMLNLLRQNYQIETNEQLAKRFGISTRTLRRKAKSLGLTKSEPVTKTKQIEELVRDMYPNHSLNEIAAEANISWRTVRRMANQMGLTRTPEEESRMRSRIRTNLIRSERRRITFGLEQRTNMKLVCNVERIQLRHKLKDAGYIVFKGNNTIFYPLELKRHPIREEHGRKVGLTFAPWCPPAVI